MGCSFANTEWHSHCIYTSYNRTHIRNAYIYIYIDILTQSFWTGTEVIRRKHIVLQTTGLGARSSTCCQWDGEDVPAPWERSKSHPPVRVPLLEYFKFMLIDIEYCMGINSDSKIHGANMGPIWDPSVVWSVPKHYLKQRIRGNIQIRVYALLQHGIVYRW